LILKNAGMGFPKITILTTPLVATSYAALCEWVWSRPASVAPHVLDFSNTHIVTLRRHDRQFQEITSTVDHFIPDGMPLIWLMNQNGAKLHDRVYGPEFTRRCLQDSPAELRHFFLGGSVNCLEKLLARVKESNPSIQIVGARNGYFSPSEEEEVISSIVNADPDCIWLGIGTPKQQIFAKRLKSRLNSGVILSVGFAFDVLAQTKEDAPAWMQKRGLTWVFRLWKEPRRLAGRYIKYNSLFLFYLIRDAIVGIRNR